MIDAARVGTGAHPTELHPKANEQFPIAGEGVLIELVQAPQDVIARFAQFGG